MIVARGYSEQGGRLENQDAYAVANTSRGFLAVVADGVGGNMGGQVASEVAVDTVKTLVAEGSALSVAAEKAHQRILQVGADTAELAGLATTLTAVICTQSHLSGISCGDSRVYVIRGNGIIQLSEDHSEYARLLSEGKLNREDAANYPRKNVLYSALGTTKSLIIDEFEMQLQIKDRIIVLTDGVYSVVKKRQIRDLSSMHDDFEVFCHELNHLIKDSSPRDNFTFVALEIG